MVPVGRLPSRRHGSLCSGSAFPPVLPLQGQSLPRYKGKCQLLGAGTVPACLGLCKHWVWGGDRASWEPSLCTGCSLPQSILQVAVQRAGPECQ